MVRGERGAGEQDGGEAIARQLLDATQDALLVLDEQSVVQYANAAAVALFGERVAAGLPFGLPITSGDFEELVVPGSDGTTTTVEMRVGQLSWRGSPARIVTFRDVNARARAELETQALLAATRAVLAATSFAEAARAVFDICKAQTGAAAGYVALRQGDDENAVLFLDPGDADCSVDPALPMPIRGLRAEAYREGRPVFDNDFAEIGRAHV